jgi:hypothetical protein
MRVIELVSEKKNVTSASVFVIKFSDIVDACRLGTLVLLFEDINLSTAFDWCLHALNTSNTDGAAAVVTHQKYTEPETSTIVVDATDATKGIAIINFDSLVSAKLFDWDWLGELHISVDAGDSDVTAHLLTYRN